MENLEKEKLITVKQITDSNTISSIATSTVQELIEHISATSKISPLHLKLPLLNYKGHKKAVLLGLFDMSTRQLAEEPLKKGQYNYIVKSLDKEAKLYYLDTGEINNIYNYIDFEELPKYYNLTYVDLPKTKVTFGMYSSKMKHAGVVFKEYILALRQLYTLNKTNSFMVEMKLDGVKSNIDKELDTVKFVVKDLEFIPKFSTKGYNLPKDREVKIGTKVKYRYQNDFYHGEIVDIRNGFQQYQDKKGRPVKNRYYYVNHNGKLLRFQLSNLKVTY